MDIFKSKKKELIVSILILIGLTLFYVLITKNNNTIKLWDHSTYWLITLNEKYSILHQSILTTIKSIYHSINYDDYNLLSSTLLMPVFMFGHGTFLSYIMSIFIIGFIPLYIVYIMLYFKIYKKESNWKKLLLFLIPFVLLPSIHNPTLEGYLDIIGIIPILIILYCTYDETFEKFNLKKTIILSICFLLTIILRRYYIYFTISYFVTLAIVYIIKKLFINKKSKLIKQGINLFIIGISFSIVFIVLFKNMILHIILGNYGNSYSAYSMGNIFYQFQRTIEHIGLPIIILFIVSSIYLIIKNKKLREYIIILITTMFISILLFNRIQTMDQHHYYIFLINFVLVISIFLVELLKTNKKINTIILIVIGLYSILNITNSFTHKIHNSLLFSNATITYKTNTREELEPVMEYLNELLKDNEDTLYTVASSGEYNNETFANYYLPETYLRSRIIPTPNVDLRDGFSNVLYHSKYVLVVTPKQLHLREKNQQVVSIIYDSIENDTPIRDNYNLIKEFNTSVNIKIYEKVKDYDNEDKEYLRDEFNKSYSKYKEMFEDRIME